MSNGLDLPWEQQEAIVEAQVAESFANGTNGHKVKAATILTAADVLRSAAFNTPRRTVSTGIEALDKLIGGGLKSRQLAVIAGPTGKGKTGLVGTLAISLARTGQCVLWITTELDDAEQASRFAAMAMRREGGTNATPDDFLGHTIPSEYGAKALDGLPLYLVNVDDPDGDTLTIIRNCMNTIREEHGTTPVLIVDYMQVLAPEESDKRRMSVSKVASAMRRIARDYDTPVIAVSSVSRAFYGNTKNKKPEGEEEDPRDWIAAAKESGDIEYAASVFGYLDTSNEMNQLGESEARLIIAKSRAGIPGFVGLKFHGPSGLFIPANESVASMRPERRKKGPPDIDRVLSYVKKHPGQTMKALKCSIAGLGKDKVEVAIEQLEVKGLVECRAEEFKDASKRVQKRNAWYLVVGRTPGEDDD